MIDVVFCANAGATTAATATLMAVRAKMFQGL
jgi:hypothetical protein